METTYEIFASNKSLCWKVGSQLNYSEYVFLGAKLNKSGIFSSQHFMLLK